MDIQDMRIFARVAELRNLSAVGAEMGLTPGTISKRLQALENNLGARLFDRTTRSTRITDEGRVFLAHVGRILQEIETACAAVGDIVSNPKGRISVSAPVSLGRRYISPAVCAFMSDYPQVDIKIDLEDRVVNLQEGGYDVAIRTGTLRDSTLIAKRLAPDKQVILASPDYLAEHGAPKTVSELAEHNCLILGEARQWSFVKNRTPSQVRVDGRLHSNNGELLRHAALEGQGIIRTSELRAFEELRTGRLVPVLTGYEVESDSAVFAVYPTAKHILPKLRAFLDFLADWFRSANENEGEASGQVEYLPAPAKPFSRTKRAANG